MKGLKNNPLSSLAPRWKRRKAVNRVLFHLLPGLQIAQPQEKSLLKAPSLQRADTTTGSLGPRVQGSDAARGTLEITG